MKNVLPEYGTGRLSGTQIKAVKPGPKEFFLNDGNNLFPRVGSTGIDLDLRTLALPSRR